jgi:nicotinamidase/pyrazinamidase
MKIHLLAIDVQKDFCDPKGALYVAGADQDTIRLANMVDRLRGKIDDIHVTLDSHNEVDIAHSIFWVDSNGKHPDPFTIISTDDVVKGVWTTTSPACRQRAVDYVKALDANGRYPLCIWPTHCVIGTQGWTIQQPFADSLSAWCRDRFKKVDYQVKGSNIFTEHYSVFKADVIDPSDPSTMLNTDLIATINKADEILIAGQARSHCVCNSIRDLISELGKENANKFILLEDAMSDVTGFENLGKKFHSDMIDLGMKTTTTVDYLA